jgi:hypothetical protein
MPHFYIDVRRGGVLASDDVGIDAPGLGEARATAMPLLRNRENVRQSSFMTIDEVVIRDEAGRELSTLRSTDCD